jgi:hypothetical protein
VSLLEEEDPVADASVVLVLSAGILGVVVFCTKDCFCCSVFGFSWISGVISGVSGFYTTDY